MDISIRCWDQGKLSELWKTFNYISNFLKQYTKSKVRATEVWLTIFKQWFHLLHIITKPKIITLSWYDAGSSDSNSLDGSQIHLRVSLPGLTLITNAEQKLRQEEDRAMRAIFLKCIFRKYGGPCVWNSQTSVSKWWARSEFQFQLCVLFSWNLCHSIYQMSMVIPPHREAVV
jgi:hypothetical protein